MNDSVVLKKMKSLRVLNRVTIKRMAEIIGTTPSYLSLIENGKRTLSYELAIRIAQILNLKPDEVFYDDFSKKK